jgi:hypothetical protein
MTTHDFESLREIRNGTVQEMHQKLADEWGISLQSLRSNFNPDACYCACGTGGPCEHKWDGPDWESIDGRAFSVTCSRCGCTAMSHDMRNAP